MAQPMLVTKEDREAYARAVACGHVQAGMWSVSSQGHGRTFSGMPGKVFTAGLFGPLALNADQRTAWEAGTLSPAEQQVILRLAFRPVETRQFEDEDVAFRFCVAQNLKAINSAQPGT